MAFVAHDDGCCPLCGAERNRPASGRVTIGDVTLDTGDVTKGGMTIRLSAGLFRFLRVLAEKPGRPVTHDTIMARLYGNSDDPPAPNIIYVMTSKLRRFIGADALETRMGCVLVFHPERMALNPDVNETDRNVPSRRIRPDALTADEVQSIQTMIGLGMTDRQIANRIGRSHVAVWKARKRIAA